jgi:hypothetical protein
VELNLWAPTGVDARTETPVSVHHHMHADMSSISQSRALVAKRQCLFKISNLNLTLRETLALACKGSESRSRKVQPSADLEQHPRALKMDWTIIYGYTEVTTSQSIDS